MARSQPIPLAVLARRQSLRATSMTTGSACLRVDDLDALHAAFRVVGQSPRFCRTVLGVLPIQEAHGLRMFVLIDPDDNLLRCVDNLYRAV
jgi:hypothetical protein